MFEGEIMQLAKTIVIKPTMNCNLRCGYCYEFIRNGTTYCQETMDVNHLIGIVWRTAKLFPDSKVLWMFHGGEPLLQGPEYLEKFSECIREVNKTYPVDYKIALQTNATLLTDKCINILEKNADLLSERIVSISIDGPREISDITRRSASEKSPFDEIENAIYRVKNSKLAFSTISVVGTHNVDRPREVYNYMKELGANLCKFVPNYNSDSNGNAEMYGIRPMEFARFMCEIFDLWMHDLPNQNDKTKMVIDPIASIICSLTKSVVTWCEYREEKCSNFTCIYPNGEMWLCDNFIHETMKDTAYVKNIFEVTDEELKKILLTPSKVCGFDAFYDKAMDRCTDCEIYEFCKGGCLPTHNEMLKKSKNLYEEYCEAKKLLINHIKRSVDLALS